MNDNKFWNNPILLIIASLSLGLAPFFPEPHIWGKIILNAGGAQGMKLLDWWDFVMLGTPWIMLLRIVILRMFTNLKNMINNNKTPQNQN